jgi:hypothetical protein
MISVTFSTRAKIPLLTELEGFWSGFYTDFAPDGAGTSAGEEFRLIAQAVLSP